MGVTDELEAALSPACLQLGVEIVDVELSSGAVRITVDRPGGLDLDAVAEVARAISQALDDAEAVAPDAPYELEVSTPGLERRLRRPVHFEAAVGQRVALRTRPGTPGDRRLTGILRTAGTDGISVSHDSGGGDRQLAYDEIERAHTVFDWRAALAGSAHGGENPDVGGNRDHHGENAENADNGDNADSGENEVEQVSTGTTGRARTS